MLDHWVLTDNFCVEHLRQSLSHFIPARHCGDIIEHRTRLVERTILLDIFDELNAPKVHVVVAVVECFVLMDALRQILRRVAQLASSKQKR